jgi:hypothetical protein
MMTAREFRDRMAALMATIHHDSQCYVHVSAYPNADHPMHKGRTDPRDAVSARHGLAHGRNADHGAG